MKNYLQSIIRFFIIGIVIMSVSRFICCFLFWDRIKEVPEYYKIFAIGLRFDLILLCYTAFLPFVLITFLPHKWSQKVFHFTRYYFYVLLILILLMELATPNFIFQYDTRPNRLFLDYLIYPKEVAGTLIKSYTYSLLFSGLVLTAVTLLFFKFKNQLFPYHESALKHRLMAFLPVAFLLFWGARSSLTSKRPINASNAIFSTEQIANTLSLNSLYTVGFAAYSLTKEADIAKKYGKMELAEAYKRVRKYMDISSEDFDKNQLTTLHHQEAEKTKQPYNVVIFLQESLGAEFVGSLGGKPLTPNFDKLTAKGLQFTHLYCTGTRSVRGIEAVTTGFIPTAAESVVKLSNAQQNFFTLAQAFKKNNYNTSFIYGGMANFDNMASFFSGNGFDNIIDETDFDDDSKKYAFKGTWGYSDEDLASKANDYFKKNNGKPFFSLMFSTSNHEPFEFPDGRIQLYEKTKGTVNNAIKYADFSIGKFFELAQKEAYFKNTIFLIVADHNTRTYGKNLVPIHKFHIPALMIGPTIPVNKKHEALTSQIDLAPSLLYKAGINGKHPMVGRNIFKNNSLKNRALMQFHDINAFRVENEVVILQPNTAPLQFHIQTDEILVPTHLNKELAKDALAHIVVANDMYKNKKYQK